MFPVPPMNKTFIAGTISRRPAGWHGLRLEWSMGFKLRAMALALSLGSGCVTTTAHRLVLAGNPLREQAIACEKKCQPLREPVREPCEQAFGGEHCTQSAGSPGDYAACLDNCPGVRVKDDDSCPDPPGPDVICVETTSANAGAIVGGLGATATVVVVLALLSSPVVLWTLVILAS
jgi:hypothetical protein